VHVSKRGIHPLAKKDWESAKPSLLAIISHSSAFCVKDRNDREGSVAGPTATGDTGIAAF
jgi:hypothetical protein